jgi:hypothetical protein
VEREGGGTHPAPPKRLPVLASSLTALALAWLVALILLATTLLFATRRAVAIVLVSLFLWLRTLVTLTSLLSGLSSLVPLTLSRIVLVSHLVSLKGRHSRTVKQN